MANYNTLKTAIQAAIKTNGNNEITGKILQQQLLATINSLGSDYQLAGTLRLADTPKTDDQRIVYLAVEPGMYEHAGGFEVTELSLLTYGAEWHMYPLGVPFGSQIAEDITAAVDAEKTRATAAEATLTKKINTEAFQRKNADAALDTRVTAIEDKIPAQASSENKLADKEFVNNSIATATATFRGTFNTLEALKATQADKNDYAFWAHKDEDGNTCYDKYTYTDAEWKFEYRLNNSSFTTAQWAALNSGVTADVIKALQDTDRANAKAIADEKVAREQADTTLQGNINAENTRATTAEATLTKKINTEAFERKSADATLQENIDKKQDIISDLTTIRTQAATAYGWGDHSEAGYLTGITKAMVESALTGNITSHTHSYLPLSGGMMTNTDKVTNLNADLLDGYDASSFAKVASANNLISSNNEFNFVPSGYAGEVNINFRTTGGKNGAITKYLFDDGAGSTLATISAGQFSGNAASSSKWSTARTITLTGSVTGSVSIDGSDNVSLDTTTNHTHTFASLTSKPTTISGYGITDAYTKTETDNKVAALQSLLDSMFERVYDSNNKLIRIHSNVTISSSGDLVAGGDSEGGGTSGGAYTQLEWNAIKALTQSESGLLASAYAVKEAYDELNTAIETLAGKATNVKFTQTLTSGKQIGSISIDGKSTSLYAPASYAWGEITGKPSFATVATSGSYTDLTNKPTIASLMGSTAIGGTSSYLYWNGSAFVSKALGSNAFTSISKVSQLTNDSGYITGITKAMVEDVLTGNITTHTHSYLPLSGGTMSNTNVVTNLNANYLDGRNSRGYLRFHHIGNLTNKDLNYANNMYGSYNYGDDSTQLNTPTKYYGAYISFGDIATSDESTTRNQTGQIAVDCWIDLGRTYVRARMAGDRNVSQFGKWRTLAFTTDNVASSSKWENARTITLTGSVTGSVSIDGSANVSLATTTNHTHNYAGSSSAGGSADSAITLLYNNILGTNYGNYAVFQQFAGLSDLPHLGWFNSIKMLHNNSSGYFTEIAMSFTGEDGMWRRALQGGSQAGWYKMLDSGNFNSYALPLSGGTITGNLTVNAESYFNSRLSLRNGAAIDFYDADGNARGVLLPFSGNSYALSFYDNTAWRTLLHSGNFNSYAPKLDGTGATGTWGISISGNAATATNADMLDGYHASSFYQYKPLRSDQNSIYDLRYNYGGYDKGDYHGTYAGEYPTNYGAYLALTYNDKNTGALMFFDAPTSNVLGHIYVRTRGAGDRHTTYSEWGTLAYLTDNVASSSKWANARTITLTGSVTGSVSIDGSQNVSLATTTNHTHTFASLTSKPTTISGYGITDGLRRVTLANNVENDFNTFENLTLTGRGDPTTGSSILNSPWTTQPVGGFGVLTYLWSGYGLQLAAGYASNDLYVRNKYYVAGIGSSWDTRWDKILNSSNFNSYSPKLDGTGATGTWGITATNAENISSMYPQLAASFEADEINVKRKIDWNNWGDNGYQLEAAIDFNWYETHNLFGVIRGGNTDSAGFGWMYSPDGSTYTPIARLSPSGHLYLASSLTISGAVSGVTSITASGHAKVYSLKTDHICIECDNSGNSSGRSSEINNYDGHLYLQHDTSHNCFICTGGGNVGIGTNSPSYKLHVVGNAYATKNIIASGDLTAGSDIRYKDKIQDLRLSVHDIALAPAFTYKWNNRKDDALVHIGSSAQYWLNTDAKDAVYYDKQNDFYHLNYASLALCNTIILARGMETQEEKIARLEERIKELEEKIRQYDCSR